MKQLSARFLQGKRMRLRSVTLPVLLVLCTSAAAYAPAAGALSGHSSLSPGTLAFLALIPLAVLLAGLVVLLLTRRKDRRILRNILEKDEMMNHLLNRLPTGIGIYAVRADSVRQVYLNDGYYKLIQKAGFSAPDPENPLSTVHPDDLPALVYEIHEAAEQKRQMLHPFRILCGNGTYRWVNLRANYVEQLPDGAQIYYVFFSDIDDTKRTQDQLVLSEHAVNIAIEQTGIVFWTYDLVARRMTLHNRAPRIFGDTDILDNFPDCILQTDIVHPDNQAYFRRMFERIRSGEASASCVVRLRDAERDRYWYAKITATAMPDETGAPVKAVGSALDVTSLMEARKHYRAKLHTFSALYTEAFSVVHLNLSQNRCIEGFSPFFSDLPHTADHFFDILYQRLGDFAETGRFLRLFGREHLLQQYAAGTLSLSVDCRFLFDDHSVKWLNVGAAITKNPNTGDLEVILRFSDIDNKKTLESLLRTVVASDYDYLLLIDCTTGNVRVFRGSKAPESASPADDAAYLARFFPEESRRQHIRAHYIGDNVEEFIQNTSIPYLLRHLKTTPAYSISCSVQDDSGAVRRKKMNYCYLDDHNRFICCTCHDITDIYDAEQAKKRVLEDALDAAIQANAAKSDFLSRMSHEIRTPMNAILGMAYLGLRESGEPIAHYYFQKVRSSAEYLLGLINDILDMSKIESQKIELHPAPYTLSQLSETIDTIIRPQCKQKNITLSYDMTTLTGKTVLLDKLRFHQILLNLLSNAMKFTDAGGHVELHVRILTQAEGCITAEFIVRDTGIGISESFLPHLFEPFSQEHSDKTTLYSGTGLGLAIVHNLVTLMGGTISVSSVPGQGTAFTVHLPMPLAEAGSGPVPPAALHGHVPPRDFSGQRVLLAEDHVLNAEIAKKLLCGVGFTVDHAANGKIALELFMRAEPKHYHAILMDIRMPVMDGLTCTRKIRASGHPDAASIPIIAMTANAFDLDIRESIAAGMNAHLAKPINPPQLYETLSAYIPDTIPL